jgi:protocatechuate 3,4-dioxygenase beta subunit
MSAAKNFSNIATFQSPLPPFGAPVPTPSTALQDHLTHWRAGLTRRRALSGLGLALLGSSAAQAQVEATACPRIPTETAGPFPANGSGWRAGSVPNVLKEAAMLRRDIRRSVGAGQLTAEGVPLLVNLKLVRSRAQCQPGAGMAVYLWQCDREGRYSLYANDLKDENYLRGVQVADAQGELQFQTIFPGCYPGRMPHLHFEVYASAAEAVAGARPLVTSQIAFPVAPSAELYRSAPGYASSVPELQRLGFERDMVFADGVALQMAALSSSAQGGQVARLAVGV